MVPCIIRTLYLKLCHDETVCDSSNVVNNNCATNVLGCIQHYGGHVYQISTFLMNFTEAADYCASTLTDGYVAVLESDEETAFVEA